MTDNYTLVSWSDFARNGREYADRLQAGESFLIVKDGIPIGIVQPHPDVLADINLKLKL